MSVKKTKWKERKREKGKRTSFRNFAASCFHVLVYFIKESERARTSIK